jgi:hypothetical protein
MSEAAPTRPVDDGRSLLRASRSRGALSVALVLVATLAALMGGVALYVRSEIVDASAFAGRAVDALHQPTMQRVLSREIVVQLIEKSSPDLVAARPVIESVAQTVIASQPFAQVFRLAVEHGHRLVFERRGGNAAFDIADAGTVVASALRSVAPQIAKRIPPRLDAILLTLRRRSFATETLRFAERVRVLGIVLPALALVLFVLAIAVAPDRRRAITRSAIAIGVSGIGLAIALGVARSYVHSHVYGTRELSTADVRAAIDELWGVYLGDLLTWTLAITAVAWVVAAASASLLAPFSSAAGLERLRALARRPVSSRVRGARGAGALALGLLAVLDPTFVLRVAAILGGALLVYVGAGEVLSAIAPAQPRLRRAARGRRFRRRAVVVAVLCAAAVTGTGIALALSGGVSKVHARASLTCNGYAQLCKLRLNQVVFAGTHNSMSAADTPGWLIANQDRAIGEQLQDGIRLFKISTHYGLQDSAGGVHTDIAAAGKQLNRVAAKLSPAARAALQRLSQALSSGSTAREKRDIWLCHTLCELGATRMVDFLGVIRRFLELNPTQVMILFDEDYVSERDLQSLFKRAGLFRYLATLQPGRPLPTLAELIRSHHNVVVFAQKPPSGKYAWNHDAFTWIQDTPLGARKPAQFTCRLGRGSPANPFLMLNNWADMFPPRRSPNIPLVTRDFVLARARQCVRQRGRIPDLILTDYYDAGDVVGAVATLNGVDGQRAAATNAVR